MAAQWLRPTQLIPPHRVTHPEKVRELIANFKEYGWNWTCPPLIGYKEGTHFVQLLSGTHRRIAAIIAKIEVPVVVWCKEEVEGAWGTHDWDRIMCRGIYKWDRLY